MLKLNVIYYLALGIVFVLIYGKIDSIFAEEIKDTECNGLYYRIKLSPEELARILKDNDKWIESKGKIGVKANLCGTILEGIDLEGAQIDNVSFKYAELININLNNAKIENSNFERAILRNIDFRGAQLDNTSFKESSLINVDFYQAQINNSNLEAYLLKDNNLEETQINKVSFNYAELNNVYFNNAKIENSYFEFAKFINIFFQGAQLSKVVVSSFSLEPSNFVNINLNQAIIKDSIFENAIFENVSFQEAQLDKVNFNIVVFEGTDLNTAIIKDSVFDYSDFNNVSFKKAQLYNTSFKAANFNRIDFTGSEIIGGNYESANFEKSHFEKTIIFSYKGKYKPNFRNTKFRLIKMRKTLIANADFSESIFEDLDASSVLFANLMLVNSSLSEADFKGTVFGKVNMSNADLSDSNIKSTLFVDSDMDRTSFYNAKISYSYFLNNSLKESIFDSTDLQLTIFRRNNMQQSNLRGVILPSRLTHTNLREIYSNTVPHFMPDITIEEAFESIVTSISEDLSKLSIESEDKSSLKNESEKIWKENTEDIWGNLKEELANVLDIPSKEAHSIKELIKALIEQIRKDSSFKKLPEKLKSAILSDPSDITKWSKNIFINGKDYFVGQLKENYPIEFKQLPKNFMEALQADPSDLHAWVKRVLLAGSDISFSVVNKNMFLINLETWSNNNLKDAILSDIDWSGVRLKFPTGMSPSAAGFYDAKNLQEIDVWESTHSLAELRDSFKKYSLRDQERDITYVIQINKRENKKAEGNYLESIFMYWFFEFTTEWGRAPNKPAVLLLYLWGIMSIVFTSVVYRWGQKELRLRQEGYTYDGIQSRLVKGYPENKPGVWATLSSYASEKNRSGSTLKCVTPSFYFRRTHLMWENQKTTTKVETIFRLWSAMCFGLFFSLYSAFQIGWTEFSLGNIIARIQTREYSLQATGWVRVLAGVNSIVSLYLIVLWVLVYFGRPFE